jgi:myo-inositol-1-phosphate synthase
MEKIRVAIAGVGNCASSLIQGVTYYKHATPGDDVPGLMHVTLGGYHVSDLEFVAAFDVDASKVGSDLSKAIDGGQNNTIKFAEVPALGVTVQRGPTMDGLNKYYRAMIEESPADAVDVTQVLRDSRAEVFVSYLPVGSEDAQRYYAQCALDAGVAFVNAIPVFIASDPVWAKKFVDAGVPIIGDDIKSQVGATIVHRVLARLFEDRGLTLDHTYQLNVGGNMDFKNMLERGRLESKKISKTQAVTSQLEISNMDPDDVHIGPSDHVPWLKDRKWAYIRMEGRNFGDVPLNVELKLEVWDSPNSAGVIIDAVRCAKVALDRGIGGPIMGPSAYFMKSPPIQYHDDVAHDMVEAFADRGAENEVWPSAEVLEEALAGVEVEVEVEVESDVVPNVAPAASAIRGSSDTLFTRG